MADEPHFQLVRLVNKAVNVKDERKDGDAEKGQAEDRKQEKQAIWIDEWPSLLSHTWRTITALPGWFLSYVNSQGDEL